MIVRHYAADGTLLSTTDTRTLADAKAAARAAVDARFARSLDTGPDIGGGLRIPAGRGQQTDLLALRDDLARRLAAGENGPTQRATLRGGVTTTLTVESAEAMSAAVGAHARAAWARQADLTDAINAAETVAAVDAVAVDSGWPEQS